MYFSEEKLLKYKPLISLLSHTNKLYAYMQLTPILMTITCAYKDKVETYALLTKNEQWINSNHFHKCSNIIMKLERNTERKYSM